ncbi:MAG: hypothetical protein Q4P33_06315 [Flaviflexus sp.]|nr:hypothetical protein [Flaviflexus sp.]
MGDGARSTERKPTDRPLVMAPLSRWHQSLFLLVNSAATVYGAFVNLPMAKAQVDASQSSWAGAILIVFIAVPAMTTTLTALTAITLKLNAPTALTDALFQVMKAACWVGTFHILAMCLVCVAMPMLGGPPLYTSMPSAQVWAPFPVMNFAAALVYAVILRFPYTFALLLSQTILYTLLCLTVGARIEEALADSLYAFVFSGAFTGATHALLSGVGDLARYITKTIQDRCAAFELDASLEQRSQVNALLHDYIIAVTVVVGRGLEVSRDAVQAAATEALGVLNRMLSDDPLCAVISPSPAEFSPEEPMDWDVADSADLSVRSFARLVRNVANAHGFSFHPRGLLTRIALSRSSTGLTHLLTRSSNALQVSVMEATMHAMLEAIRNAHRHAEATHCDIKLRLHLVGPARFTLRICDNGKGFDVNPSAYGFGIRNSLFARMNEVGGEVSIDSRPGGGCCVSLTANLLTVAAERPTELRFSRPAGGPAVLSSATDVFLYYVCSKWGRLTAAGIVAVQWLFVYVAATQSTSIIPPIVAGLALTAGSIPIALRPAMRPTAPFIAVFLVGAAILPAYSISALPTFPHPSQSTFALPFLVFIMLWMWGRGVRFFALLSFVIACISFAWGSQHYGFQPPMPWDVIGRNIGAMVFFTLAFSVTSRVYSQIQQEFDTQGILQSMRVAATRALAQRQQRVRDIDDETRELLTELAGGADPAELRQVAAVTEQQLRDFLRAAGLSVTPLREEARRARQRGVKIRLVDDSRGHTNLTPLIDRATEIIRRSNAGSEITVRALPPGKESLGTILLTGSGREQLILV